MKRATSLLIFAIAAAAPTVAFAQGRPGAEFAIGKISRNLITPPNFTYSGAQQYQTNQRDRWLEIEVEFAAAPEFTDELTFKYYINP